MFELPQGVSAAADALDAFRYEQLRLSRQTASRYNHNLENSLAAALGESKTDEWRNDGNEELLPETALIAKAFVETLPVQYQNPDIAPEPDGHLSLEWYVDKRRLLSVSVDRNGTLHWAALIGNEDPRGSYQFTGKLPPTIAFMLERIFNHD